tara:strand:- start:1190 stop:2125 length:936 start_codon:yes stop_codon:yes gene_type:complete
MKFKKPYFWDLPKPNIISYLLIPLTLPIIIRNFIFNYIKKKRSSKIKTICVGNIYIGGTGKTPLTIKIYEILNALNTKVATVKKNHFNQVDEQLLLEKKTSLIVSKTRESAIKQGIDEKYKILIFDDGLQETKIDYDLKLVCFKSKVWIGNGQYIPAGPLREKISSLKKFDVVFLNGYSDDYSNIEKQIKNVNPNIKIFRTSYKITNISSYDLKSKYLIFSGIGTPYDFKDILLKNNFDITKQITFPDHYNYKQKDLKKISSIAKKDNLKIITTEKDYMKIPDQFKKNINFLAIDLLIEEENKLINLLKEL